MKALLQKITGSRVPTLEDLETLRARVKRVQDARGVESVGLQREAAKADDLRRQRSELMIRQAVDGEDVADELRRVEQALTSAEHRHKLHEDTYKALATTLTSAEGELRGAEGRRAPTRAREIAEAYKRHAGNVRNLAEAQYSEAEALTRTHNQTIPASLVSGGALSLRHMIENQLLSPLRAYQARSDQQRAAAIETELLEEKWAADRQKMRAEFQGDPESLVVYTPRIPQSGFTAVVDNGMARPIYPEDQE